MRPIFLALLLAFSFGCSSQPINHQQTTALVSPSPARNTQVVGNRNSKIYHWPGCPNYADISPANRVIFNSPEEAESQGYRAARNCRTSPPRKN